MIYELTYLTIRPNQLGPVLSGLPAALPEAVKHGKLLGVFNGDLGAVNKAAILAAYEDMELLQKDRDATMKASNPYGVATYLSNIDKAAFKPLSFSQDIEIGNYGPFYEIRTYEIAPNGLSETETAWAKVVDERNKLSKLLMVMASIDTMPTRMVHIWPYSSLDHRASARAEAGKLGLFPPPGGSNQLLSLKSELFLPLAASPLK